MNSFQELNQWGNGTISFTSGADYVIQFGASLGNGSVTIGTYDYMLIPQQQPLTVFANVVTPLIVRVGAAADGNGATITGASYVGPSANITVSQTLPDRFTVGNIWTIADYDEAFANTRLTIPVDRAGNFVYPVTISDQQGNTATFSVAVTVVPFTFQQPASITYNEDEPAAVTFLINDFADYNYTVWANVPAAVGNLRLASNGYSTSNLVLTNTASNIEAIFSAGISLLPAADGNAVGNITARVYNNTQAVEEHVGNTVVLFGNSHAEYSAPEYLTFFSGNANLAGFAITDTRPDNIDATIPYTVTFTVANVAGGNLAYSGSISNVVSITNTKANINSILSANSVVFVGGNTQPSTSVIYQQTQDANSITQANIEIPLYSLYDSITVSSGTYAVGANVQLDQPIYDIIDTGSLLSFPLSKIYEFEPPEIQDDRGRIIDIEARFEGAPRFRAYTPGSTFPATVANINVPDTYTVNTVVTNNVAKSIRAQPPLVNQTVPLRVERGCRLTESNDFTFEWWFYHDATANQWNQNYQLEKYYQTSGDLTYSSFLTISMPAGLGDQIAMTVVPVGNLANGYYSASYHVGNANIVNAWHHCAVVRSGSTFDVFYDGVKLVANATTTSGNVDLSVPYDLGNVYIRNDTSTPRNNVLFWDQIRFSSNSRYSGNFTVNTTPWTLDNNTNFIIEANLSPGATGNTAANLVAGLPPYNVDAAVLWPNDISNASPYTQSANIRLYDLGVNANVTLVKNSDYKFTVGNIRNEIDYAASNVYITWDADEGVVGNTDPNTATGGNAVSTWSVNYVSANIDLTGGGEIKIRT